ncbi:MAG: hypothetical protein EBW18_01505 [Burkholderiaceae bacterium]|nr:hypothetical protein [Burkholderiaceae bacterium]
MTADLWILLSLALLTELLTLPPLVARGSVPGGIKWIFYNRDTELASVAPWGGRAVRAHSNLADNLAMYAVVIGIAHFTDQVFRICEPRYSRSRRFACWSMSGKPLRTSWRIEFRPRQ